MMTTVIWRVRASSVPTTPAAHRPTTTALILRSLRVPNALAGTLALVTAVSAAGTFFISGTLLGPAVMNGSARGTALVMLVVAVPLLVASIVAANRGSTRAVLAWLGASAYILYSDVLFLFATPVNRFFLLYEAMLGLALATIVAVVARVDLDVLRAVCAQVPVRPLALWIWVVAAANGLLWLRNVVPELGTKATPQYLLGSGLTTNPIYVQDLAIWLPLAAVAASWLWHRRAWGYLLAGALLCFWFVEGISVAVDQYFGAHADPTSTIATMGGCWLFVAMTAANAVAVTALLRRVGAEPGH